MMPTGLLSDPGFVAAAVVAVMLLGLTKGGFSGLGSIATPLLALTVPPTQAAAIVLPILIVQDVVSVWNFRHEWDRWIVGWMPLAIASTLAGVWLVRRIDAARFYGILYLLMILLGGKLMADAFR